MAASTNNTNGIGGAFKSFFLVLTFFALLVGSFFAGRYIAPKKVSVETILRDTVVIRDTIRFPEPKPQIVYLTRVDTVLMREVKVDTAWVQVQVPIERKVYQTEEYRAEIEGFRPSLVNMEVYPKTKIITDYKTIKETVSKKWGVGIHVGYGYAPMASPVKLSPVVSIGVQYNILTW
jgi:hypothetical protein